MSYLPFIPNTDADRAARLKRIGVPAFDALIANIPKELRWQGDLPIPEGLSEPEIVRELTELAAQNEHAGTCDMYLGAGAYDHYIPAVIDHIITRSEWYTAYTPYQPEVSQGTLQDEFHELTLLVRQAHGGQGAANPRPGRKVCRWFAPFGAVQR